MTKKELYMCNICHTNYCNKEDVLKREKDHLKCVKITDARYNAYLGLPYKIEVEFSDGTKR